MKKIHIIIFTVTLLLISFLCIKYIENIPHENERISYAKTNILGHGGGHYTFDIQIEKNGTISIDGRNFKSFELKPIFKSVFDRFGCDFPISLHVDKDSKMSAIKSIIDEILLANWHRILLIARGKNSGLYRFRVIIDKDESKSKNINIIGARH
jgi:biopolymer transport protein ExbD